MGADDFDQLVAEANDAPVDGWGFSWLDGRATEERPSWGYARTLPTRLSGASAVLDVQTGGAEVFVEALGGSHRRPRTVVATEGWPPNRVIAARNLAPFAGSVVGVPEGGALPFRAGAFDLVVSRHPVITRWDEVSRVLRPGGRYFAQHVGSGSNRELTEFLMGPQLVSGAREPARAAADATAQGLEVVDLRRETLRVEFFDVGAVVYFLRKVIWTVPGFTSDAYREPLRRLHDQIRSDGRFVSHSERFLIEAVHP
jgi:SAM-dependent methyltransferase